MKITDITRELFSAKVYPGDPVPSYRHMMGYDKEVPDICQVSELFLGSHSGTHLDAPLHFLEGEKDVSQVELSRAVGECLVVSAEGEITAEKAREFMALSPERLLIKGDTTITPQSAEVFAEGGLLTLGVEGMTVGTKETGPQVHRILLGAEILIIESLDLSSAEDGKYILSAAPLKMAGLDGSPVRAILISI
ncbi:MAG: Kynurenine formamidase [Firmicutes bacterium ADurb.BinA205]|nr:MAG: Kynurenine formamidase [Firmicutes bacterium ADurb.BinA205]